MSERIIVQAQPVSPQAPRPPLWALMSVNRVVQKGACVRPGRSAWQGSGGCRNRATQLYQLPRYIRWYRKNVDPGNLSTLFRLG
jgi:hypothetical protein